MSDILKEIESHILFRGITEKDVRSIAEFSKEEIFKKETFIFETGSPADAIYLIIKGRISVEMHEPVRGSLILESLTRGQLLGLSWLTQPAHWIFDARCLDEVTVIRVDAKELGEFCDSHTESGYIIMKNLALLIRDRLQATRLQLMDIYATSREVLRI